MLVNRTKSLAMFVKYGTIDMYLGIKEVAAWTV